MSIEKKTNAGISRRDFLKGMAGVAAGLGVVTILPGNVIAASNVKGNSLANNAKPEKVGENSLTIEGLTEDMNGQEYTLEFVQPIKLVARVNGEVQTEGTWRSSAKQLVTVDPLGTVIMHDGVGGNKVVVSWSLGDVEYKVTLNTSPTAGAHAIEVDRPMTRGAFMVRLNRYFNWYHYNVIMDDGEDVDDNAEYLDAPRVRNYKDVTGVADYVKPIESALDLGILQAESSDDCFYPLAHMTRQDAAVIICSAFHLAPLKKDFIKGFSDIKKVDPECYEALNTLVGRNFFRGRTNDTLNPTDAITATEARIIIEELESRVSSPVWGTPVSHRKLNRIRPELFTANDQATIQYRFRSFNISDPRLEGLKAQDITLSQDGEWSEWKDYIQDYTIDAYFGMQSSNFLPYDRLSHGIEFEAKSVCEGLEDSGVTRFVWRIERAAWHDFAIDKIHEGGENFPMVYRFFDNFQAAAYYIEGKDYGILFDGLMPTNTSTTLYDRVKNEFATPGKPIKFVLGHNHGDHNGAMGPCHKAGCEIYLCDRVGPAGGKYTVNVRAKDYISGSAVESSYAGTYTGDNVHIIDEGFVFDLGNCKMEVIHLPGHMADSLLLYDRANGLLFSSDIYGVNRYWVADQFSAKGVKQDLLLSLHQQLMDFYAKDGGAVKELYTGHNRAGVGADYLTIWERCLQKLVDFGPDKVVDDRRADGAILSRDGDPYDDIDLNWCGFTISGKQKVAYYQGQYDLKPFRRIEIDNTGASATVESNMYYDYKKVARLSNISFRDAELVGHEFKYNTGFNTVDDKTADGRLKYVLQNKFVPMDLDYDVKVKKGQTSVTFTPVAMSNRIQAMTVNGKPHSSRCPITVKTNAPAKITVVGPDGTETLTYTLTFVEA